MLNVRTRRLQYVLLLLPLTACDPLEILKDFTSGDALPTSESNIGDPNAIDFSDPRFQDPAYGLSEQEINELFSQASCSAFSEQVLVPVSNDYGKPQINQHNHGVLGSIFVPNTGFDPANYQTLDQFVGKTERVDGSLYLESISTPTRAFSTGFPTFSGTFLKDANNQKLVEWFHIVFSGFIKLDANDDGAGEYELASLPMMAHG